MDISFEEVCDFHGHVCPGLAIGYVMARAGLRALADARSEDEELVAVVENDACGVDAVQYLTGCTFGKGNLVFRDYGKQAYTFFHRASGKAVRVTPLPGDRPPGETREARIQRLISAPAGEIAEAVEVDVPAPDHAQIRNSVDCAFCGERVMETRARVREGKTACIPCAETT